MSKHQDLALYFISLFCTLFLFGFLAMFLWLSAENVKTQDIFTVSTPDPLHTQVELLGSELALDYTPLAEPGRIRREYAPLLTPRPLLTAEYAVGYASYWGEVFYNNLLEYIFAKESYGPDVMRVNASSPPESAPEV